MLRYIIAVPTSVINHTNPHGHGSSMYQHPATLLAYLEIGVLRLCLGTLLEDLLQQQCVLAHALHWLQQVGGQVHAVTKLQLLLLHTHPREHARVCLASNSHHMRIAT